MATISTLASIAAATAAGYKYTAWQGIDSVQRVQLDIPVTGPDGSGGIFYALGESTSLTTAKTNALASLNANRMHRYAGSSGAASGATISDSVRGNTLVKDKT